MIIVEVFQNSHCQIDKLKGSKVIHVEVFLNGWSGVGGEDGWWGWCM